MSLQMECRKEKRMGGGQRQAWGGHQSSARREGRRYQLCLRLSPHVQEEQAGKAAAAVFSLGTSIGGKAVSKGMSDRCWMGAALGKGKIHFPEKRKVGPGTRGIPAPTWENLIETGPRNDWERGQGQRRLGVGQGSRGRLRSYSWGRGRPCKRGYPTEGEGQDTKSMPRGCRWGGQRGDPTDVGDDLIFIRIALLLSW